MTKKALKKIKVISSKATEQTPPEVVRALNELENSAWKQQKEKISSEEYKKNFINQVSGSVHCQKNY